MEFVIVRFPAVRNVNVDSAPQGKTGKVLRLQAGTHRFDLGTPADYRPASQTIQVNGTSMASPMEVLFEERTVRAAAGGRRKPGRPAAAPARGRARKTIPQARKSPVPARAKAATTSKGAKAAVSAAGVTGIRFRTATQTFSFKPS